MESKENIMKTGTTTVGIVCKDGIVLAADKRVTTGNLIAQKAIDKIYNITDNVAVTIAGTASDAIFTVNLMKSEVQLKKLRTGIEPSVNQTANLLARMVYSKIRTPSMIPGIMHFILAGSDENGAKLYDIFPDGSINECEEFMSSGSGSVMVYGVLETLYKKGLTVDEGVDLAVKCVNAAIQHDNASGNGIDIYTITKNGAKKVFNQVLEYKIKK